MVRIWPSDINLSSVCLSVCLFVCYQKCYRVTHLNISAKSSQNLTKLSAYDRIGLLSWIIMFVRVHLGTFTHSAWKRACYFWDSFASFFVCFWSFWSLFLMKMKKNGGHTSDRYQRGATFSFYSFFSISRRKSSKMAEMCPKMGKNQLFWPLVAKICKLGIKVIKKQSFLTSLSPL